MFVRLLAVLMGASVMLFPSGSVCAQSDETVSIAAQATPSEVGTSGIVTFKIEVQGVPMSQIETPDPPSTTNLSLQEATPVTQRQLSFNSGRLQRRVTFRWRYQPMRVGIGRFQPVTVRTEQDAYKTDEVRVRIVRRGQRRTGRAQQRPGRSHSGPDRSRRDRSDPKLSPKSNDRSSQDDLAPRDVFIRVIPSTDTAYQNQEVTAEYRLFFRPNVRMRKSRMADAWDAPGFWREELDVDSRPIPETTRRYGRTYKSIVLKRVALFPTRPGRLQVDPLRIKTEARVEPDLGGRTERPSRSYYEPMSLSSEALVVQSEPLPEGAPAAFNGAVGQFALTTEISRDSVAVGEGIDISARVRGRGNLATVSAPLVEVPSDFERFEPAVETEIERSDSTVHGEKTFSYTVVPTASGDYMLPPIRFSYFNPETEQYETHRSTPTALQVTGEAPGRAVGQMGDGLPVGDIAGPMEAKGQWIRTDRVPLHAQPWAYAAVLGVLTAAVGAIAYRRRERPYIGEGEKADSDALGRAQQRLREAKVHLHDEDGEAFYRELEHTVLRFLDQRLDLPRPAPRMTADAFDRVLRGHQVPSTDRNAFRKLVSTCNQAQFGPSEPPPDVRADALQQAQMLLSRLDDALPGPSDASA